jgi:hypothetical protein
MAKATPILSSKREAERLCDRHRAILVLARRQAKKLVEARIKDSGVRLTTYPYAQLRALADEYFNQHRAELLAHATNLIERGRASRICARKS